MDCPICGNEGIQIDLVDTYMDGFQTFDIYVCTCLACGYSWEEEEENL